MRDENNSGRSSWMVRGVQIPLPPDFLKFPFDLGRSKYTFLPIF